MRLRFETYLIALFVGVLVATMSSNAKDNDPDGVVTKVVDPSEQKFEWTLERMLMATPMPMAQEERQFFSTHPTLDGIRTWTPDQFKKYISSPLGKRHAAEESVRWRELASMLTKQLTAVQPLFGKSEAKADDKAATPTEAGFDADSVADAETALSGPAVDRVFARMKIWRQEIADKAARVEALRKQAQSQGFGQKFEQSLSEVE